ncbi:MAG: purine-nucleoside phosphorylase [Bacteroidales bacterium]|nr:purine-nucleoside phosphorylase [Bacteroidales bacterium]
MLEMLKETVDYINKTVDFKPEIGIVLGTGLGGLVNEIESVGTIKYENIPHFPVSTVEGHAGQLMFGYLGGKKVVAMQGRFHFYEGYSMKDLAIPIRTMKLLGVHTVYLSNAAGGMNPNFKVGDVMLITDHINLMGNNPLMGKNDDDFGPRFPDMSAVYDKALIEQADKIAQSQGLKVQRGVYLAVSGPTFETPAEYRMMWRMGADAVGMSTVPEAIVARHAGMKCFALSIITDLGVEGIVEEVSHEEVLEVANAAESKMTGIIKELIQNS